jgi:hypothetical protein
MSTEKTDFLDLLEIYSEGPAKLKNVLAGLGDDALDLRPEARSWSIRQITHHIVDGDELWKTCILAILGNGQGVFSLQWYWDVPQDQWADCWEYANRPVEPVLERFAANRAHVVELIERTPRAGNKHMRICWPNNREEAISVSDVIEMQAGHAMGHIEDIVAILSKARDA